MSRRVAHYQTENNATKLEFQTAIKRFEESRTERRVRSVGDMMPFTEIKMRSAG